MLTIRRHRSPFIRTIIPKHRAVDVHNAVSAITSSVNPATALASITPTKTFLRAKLDGIGTMEAKALAGISSQKSVATIFKEPVAKLILEEVLAEDPKFSDRGLVRRLGEMWECEDDVYNDDGRRVGKRANWDVRKFAFSNVIELRGYKHKKEDPDKAPQATQIIFNVTPVPNQMPLAVDVPASE